MEPRVVAEIDWVGSGRENLIATYLSLALQLEGVQKIQHPCFTGCISRRPYAFSNFVVGIQASVADEATVVADLRDIARASPSLRVFSMTGDEPLSLRSRLRNGGFLSVHRMVQMGTDRAIESFAQEPWQAESAYDRARVSHLMQRVFFPNHDQLFREAVQSVTVASGHALYGFGPRDKPEAAVMVVQTQSAWGLYNLCVLPGARSAGLGSEMVRWVQAAASVARKPLVLQCDSGLQTWYERLGFTSFGDIESFSARFS